MQKFTVGDKVIRSPSNDIGVVVRITEKRKDVIVDYGNYTETYSQYGHQKGSNVWYSSGIRHLTPEIEKELTDKKLIQKCKYVFKHVQLTLEQAKQILEILEG